MSPLGNYLRDELHRRDWSPEEFGRRSGLGTSHIYQIIAGTKANNRQATVEKIAGGLGMSPGELMRAVESQWDADPIEQAVMARVAEMREAVRDTPREFWGTIIKATFDRAIEGARDMANLLSEAATAEAGVSKPAEPPVRTPNPPHNDGTKPAEGDLPLFKHPLRPVLVHS